MLFWIEVLLGVETARDSKNRVPVPIFPTDSMWRSPNYFAPKKAVVVYMSSTEAQSTGLFKCIEAELNFLVK